MEALFKKRPKIAHVPISEIKNIPDDVAIYQTNSPYRPNIHFGQLKLLLSELDFINLTNDGGRAIAVYAGACPFIHGGILLEKYPNMTFITIDPAELFIRFTDGKNHYHDEHTGKVAYIGNVSGNNTYKSRTDKYINHLQADGTIIRRAYAEIADAEIETKHGLGYTKRDGIRVYHFSGLATVSFMSWLAQWIRRNFSEPIYFWSDIRSSPDNTRDASQLLDDIDNQAKFEIGVIRDNCLNYLLHRILCPAISMFKFRAPFIDSARMSAIRYHAKSWYPDEITEFLILAGIPLHNYIEEMCKTHKFKYVNAEVRTQAFAGGKSSETRMIIREKVPSLREWDVKQFENRMYYYNTILRPFVKFANGHADISRGICHCGDCARACAIDYESFIKFANLMHYNFHQHGHGGNAHNWTWKHYCNMSKKYTQIYNDDTD